MVARHGGEMFVVLEKNDAGDDEISVYGTEGRIAPDALSFDPASRELKALGPQAAPRAEHGGANGVGRRTRAIYLRRYFDRMPKHLQPGKDTLSALGASFRFDDTFEDQVTAIPVAYTYLCQFIFHDVTAMIVPDVPTRKPTSARTASLDLDSVFGPELETEAAGAKAEVMPIGKTLHGKPYDLPRRHDGEADIVDRRNDDNLPLAQTHMALIRFFNAIVKACPGILAGEARKLAVTHFQSIVLHDVLPRLVQQDLYEDIIKKRRAIIEPDGLIDGKDFQVPLEFAAACARFGHAMIRNIYPNWNDKIAAAKLEGFWENTYNSCVPPLGGSAAEPRECLSDGWVAQWERLLSEQPSPTGDPPLFAARIDTIFANQLERVPDVVLPEPNGGPPVPSSNIAALSLLRGLALELDSGQSIAEAMREKLKDRRRPDFAVLTPEQVRLGESEEVCELLATRSRGGKDLTESTPLWLYTLKEAAAVNDGKKLGPVAGRIVMETLHAAIEASPHSILRMAWKPDPRLMPATADRYTFHDLIAFAGLSKT